MMGRDGHPVFVCFYRSVNVTWFEVFDDEFQYSLAGLLISAFNKFVNFSF